MMQSVQYFGYHALLKLVLSTQGDMIWPLAVGWDYITSPGIHVVINNLTPLSGYNKLIVYLLTSLLRRYLVLVSFRYMVRSSHQSRFHWAVLLAYSVFSLQNINSQSPEQLPLLRGLKWYLTYRDIPCVWIFLKACEKDVSINISC